MNLTAPGTLKQLARQISEDIDTACIQRWNEGPRSHLGASQIGHNCSYYLAMLFRWAFYVVHSGQQYRLFQRGHFEERRFYSYLEWMNCTIKMFSKVLLYHPGSDTYFYGDPKIDNVDGTVECVEDMPTHEIEAAKRGVALDKGKRQIRISGCKGHFGGSTDGQVILPKHYNVPGWVLVELKTQGLGKKYKNFDELVAKGVVVKKPQHFAQMSVYGYKLGLEHAIYIAVNKNDDNLHVEVVKLDHYLGEALERKAEMIIFGETPPAKVSMSPAYFECTWCDAKEYCHNGKPVDKNCRSCKNCVPVEDSMWCCEYYNQIVPKEFLKDGCGNWVSYF